MRRSLIQLLMVAATVMTMVGCVTGGSNRSSNPGRVITPQHVHRGYAWSNSQRLEPVSMQSIRMTRSASHHFLRVRGEQKPQVYDHRDLVITVLSGRMRLYMGSQAFELQPGDVVDLPRGTVHWLENRHSEPSEAYVVVTPPLQPGDVRVIEPTRAGL